MRQAAGGRRQNGRTADGAASFLDQVQDGVWRTPQSRNGGYNSKYSGFRHAQEWRLFEGSKLPDLEHDRADALA